MLPSFVHSALSTREAENPPQWGLGPSWAAQSRTHTSVQLNKYSCLFLTGESYMRRILLDFSLLCFATSPRTQTQGPQVLEINDDGPKDSTYFI